MAIRFGQAHKLVSYAIAGLGLWALTLGDVLEPAFEVVLALAFVGSFFAEGKLLQSEVYQRTWATLLSLVLIVQLVRMWSGMGALVLAVEFSAVLQISRLANRRGAREAQQLTLIAFLHLIAATVLTTSLSYAVVFLAFVLLAPWMLTLSHLREEAEQRSQHGLAPKDAELAYLQRTDLLGPRFFAGTALMALPIFVCTAVLFLLFPRVGLGLISFGYGQPQRVAGFGGTVDLGQFGTIRQDPTVVVRVYIDPKQGLEPSALRLRGTSFDHYDGRRWVRTINQSWRAEHIGDQYSVQRWPTPDDFALPLEIEAMEENVIFLPQYTVALQIPGRLRNGLDSNRHILRSSGMEFRYVDSDDQGLRYTALLSPKARAVDIHEPRGVHLRQYLALPPGHEKTEELAKKLSASGKTDFDKARLLERYLRDSGNFSYSTTQAKQPGSRPLEDFLFKSHTGHCEYFATALVILLRASGIPARHVTGFLGGRYNPYGKYIAVRQGDAHSWTEAYLGEQGWFTFDPTPPSRTAAPVESGLLAQLRAFMDASRARWSAYVVSYDLRKQVRMLRSFSQWLNKNSITTPSKETPSLRLTAEKKSKFGWAPLAWTFAGMALASLLAGILWWVFRVRRAGNSRRVHHATVLYRELEQVLDKSGKSRPAQRTPLEHALILKQEDFVGADLVWNITQRYMESRYGSKPITPIEKQHLHHQMRELERRLVR